MKFREVLTTIAAIAVAGCLDGSGNNTDDSDNNGSPTDNIPLILKQTRVRQQYRRRMHE